MYLQALHRAHVQPDSVAIVEPDDEPDSQPECGADVQPDHWNADGQPHSQPHAACLRRRHPRLRPEPRRGVREGCGSQPAVALHVCNRLRVHGGL